MNRTGRNITHAALAAMMAVGATSCFTGVESTPKVTMSRQDVGRIRSHPEDRYMDTIRPTMLGMWMPGKRFHVTDSRVVMTFLQESMAGYADSLGLAGKTLSYKGSETAIHPDGQRSVTICLSDGKNTYRYDTGMSEQRAPKEFSSYDMEMLVDLDAVADVDRLMRGNTYFTRSTIWYTPDGKTVKGRRFVPVRVDSVGIGNLIFPLRVNFTDDRGEQAYMLMNLRGTGSGSRSFQTLFYLDDLRRRYPQITDDVWQLICEGSVRKGMTKDECRLALGYPASSGSGISDGFQIDVWQYDGGRYLRFEDGILTDFRQ